MARDLLLEIGTEELPASFVRSALDAMPGLVGELFASARLTHGAIETFGTPRRLAVRIAGVADAQSDLSETVLGPPKEVAVGADGKLTRAGEGFAKKQGVAPDAIQIVETEKGAYVGFRREEKGRLAREILPEVLATLCRRLPFPKAMRWADLEVAFGRPVHWLIALHGEEVVPFQFAGAGAGRETRGHRFLAPQTFAIAHPDRYVESLEKAHVVVDVALRRERMRAALERAAEALGGELVEDAFLLEECTSLVEEPHVVPGRFGEEFLTLPEDVIVSVMRDHQRYFAVRAKGKGPLLPRYLNVVNTANDPETIARGNDRVLRARLSDARFFVDEDRKRPLATRRNDLDGIVYQAKLGSVGEKVSRIAALAVSIGRSLSLDLVQVQQAANLAKADLVTLIVGEFPELQGEMGRFYAHEQGAPAAVADAISEHYRPRGASDAVPSGAIGAALAIADRLDTLVGCFGVGLIPSGSADPFALRRAALGVVRIALEGPMDVLLRTRLGEAYALYEGKNLAPRDEVLGKLEEFVRARLRAYYGERFPGDLVEACLGAWNGESLRDLDARVRAVAAFRETAEYESLAVAFKRAYNIAREAPEGDPRPDLLTEAAESALFERFGAIRPNVEGSVAAGDYDAALRTIARELRGPIDRFFETVFVMVDDAAVRDNRLRLLGSIARTLTRIAHFHQLST